MSIRKHKALSPQWAFHSVKKIYLSAEIIQNDFTHIDYMKRVHYGTFKLDSSITLIKACMGCSELYVP